MIQIVPAILDKTLEDFKNHINQLESSQSFKKGWVHIDFADNKFVPNQTIGVDIVSENSTMLKKEAHLMVEHPLEWIEKLKIAGFNRIVFHFESKDDISEVIESIKNSGMEAGIAINPETKIELLEPYKDKIDQVLIMGIIPGFQGQPFIPGTINRIEDLKSKGWPVKISVDGSVRDENARQLVQAGVDQLVSGSFLLKGNIDENIEKLWEAIKGA